MLKDRIISVGEFMGMLNIKSRTTFNKYAKDHPGFPNAIEWPPNSKSRGWYQSEAEDYVNQLMDSAPAWSDVEAG